MLTKHDTAKISLALAVAVPLAFGGCGKDAGDEFRDGVPQHQDVALAFPGGGDTSATQGALSAGGASETQAALLGEKAELYTVTRNVTVVVNAATVAVLGLVKTITDFPPSSVEMDTAVWGPHTEPLSPNTWRLTVHRTAEGMFTYALDAKAKTADDTAYLTILSGHHNVANPGMRRRANLPAYGHGDFLLDWDKAQMLPEHDDNVGLAAFTYSRETPLSPVTIGVVFTQVLDRDTGMRIDATYDYSETPGMGGNFRFGITKDAITTTPALETLSVRSRWLQTGAGRSDVKLVGGDLVATVATSNECWDSNFLSVFETNSYNDPAKMWGVESACAFTPAEYAAP